MNQTLDRIVGQIPADKLLDRFDDWRKGQRKLLSRSMAGFQRLSVTDALDKMPRQASRWVGTRIPEAKFLLLSALLADEALMRTAQRRLDELKPRRGLRRYPLVSLGLSWLPMLGLGAGMMYFFDPQWGSRRRHQVRDQVVRMAHDTGDALDAATGDLTHRARGLISEGKSLADGGKVSDDALVQRARGAMEHLVSHPDNVTITAHDGHLIVSGPVMPSEEDRLLKRLGSIRGVIGIENRLYPRGEADDFPGVQGEPRYHPGATSQTSQ